ncbi:MAG: hypothetical protein HY662_05375 [Chloroflexi bacterium]|nr:hypothetical protein [Chloroflexota bacterium]
MSLLFAFAVLDQFFARRKPYQLVWAVGIFMYAVSTFTEFLVETGGVSEIAYRLWYLFGAIYVAAYLGMGTVYLLCKRRTAHTVLGILLVLSLVAAFRILTVDIDVSKATALTGLKAMPVDVRAIAAPLFNTFGTVALVGGAAYSAWIFWRKRILPHRVISNILIAIGALLPAIGGSVAALGSARTSFYLLELAGIIIIFIGFMRNREVFGLYRFPLLHGFKKVSAD